ncbi:hypothetical protein GEMRC1_005253 [Eukaryota sp. GEM-RC1]
MTVLDLIDGLVNLKQPFSRHFMIALVEATKRQSIFRATALMKVVFAIALFVALAFAGCRCPGSCGSGYSGSVVDCFCWCQRAAASMGTSYDATCSHFPSGSFSSGGCSLCDSTIRSLSTETFVVEIFEKSLSEAIMGVDSNHGKIFPVHRCKCHDGTCNWGFSGNYNQCDAWANGQAYRFLNGQYTVSFFPRGSYSSGGCSICGQTDPCKSF